MPPRKIQPSEGKSYRPPRKAVKPKEAAPPEARSKTKPKGESMDNKPETKTAAPPAAHGSAPPAQADPKAKDDKKEAKPISAQPEPGEMKCAKCHVILTVVKELVHTKKVVVNHEDAPVDAKHPCAFAGKSYVLDLPAAVSGPEYDEKADEAEAKQAKADAQAEAKEIADEEKAAEEAKAKEEKSTAKAEA